jgi:hypothetical protein
MDSRLTSHTNDEIVQDALRTYPVASLPVDLTSAVMSRIQQTSAPRFRITLNDLLLSIVFTAVLLAAVFGIRSLPAPMSIQLRIQGILLWQNLLVNARWLIPALFFGLILLLVGTAIPTLMKMTIDRRR